MKYISEITGKTYDTVEDCTAAEKAFVEAKKTESQRKKELCAKIDVAEKLLAKAREDDKAVKEEVQEECKALREKLEKSRQVVANAEAKKYEAIAAFVDEFGPYNKTVTGEDAIKEYKDAVDFWQDAIDYINNIFSLM